MEHFLLYRFSPGYPLLTRSDSFRVHVFGHTGIHTRLRSIVRKGSMADREMFTWAFETITHITYVIIAPFPFTPLCRKVRSLPGARKHLEQRGNL
jgi:hypothetical protein